MKKIKFLLLAPLIILPYSTSSMALTLQYRHQYTDNKTNEDRIQLDHRFDNKIGVTLFNDFISGSGQGHDKGTPFNELGTKGTKLAINYQYKPLHNFFIQPGFGILFSSNKYTYHPEVKLQYNLTKKLYVAFRYRYEYTRNTTAQTMLPQNDGVNREDIWVGYNIGNVGLVYSYMHRRGEHIRADNSKSEFWNNVRLQYTIDKNWKPYVELANVADTTNKASSGRQTRYRIGVAYTF